MVEVDKDDILRFIVKYIQHLPEDIGNGASRGDLLNVFYRGIQTYVNDVKLATLDLFENVTFHRDDSRHGYFYFRNGFVKVTGESITLCDYAEIGQHSFIWKSSVNPREVNLVGSDTLAVFEQFLHNICRNDDERFQSLCSIIGYLIHRYKDPTKSKAVIFIDEKLADVDDANGGSGKSLIGIALSHIRSTVTIPGKIFKSQGDFAYQRVDHSTDIVVINDIRHNENLETFYNHITDDWVVNKKHKKEELIKFSDAPKLVMITNVPIKSPAGESSERRISEFEVSDFYGLHRQPIDDFKHRFFEDWDDNEYNRFYNFMFRCCQLYLQKGIIQPPKINIQEKKLQRELGPELVEFLEEKLNSGIRKFHKKSTYKEFIGDHPDQKKYYRSTNRFTSKVKLFLLHRNLTFIEMPANSKEFIEITDTKIQPSTVPIPVVSKTNPAETEMKKLEQVSHSYRLINNLEELGKLVDELKDCSIVSVDIETDSLDPHGVDLVGIAFSQKEGMACFVSLPEVREVALKWLQVMRPIFDDEKKIIVGHNFKFDFQVLLDYGINVAGKIMDTMVMYHLLHPDEKKKGLKELSRKLLAYQQVEYSDLIAADKKIGIRSVNIDRLCNYACEDADQTLRIFNILDDELKTTGLYEVYNSIESGLIKVLANMEYYGVKIDLNALSELGNRIQSVISETEVKVKLFTGEEINLNSTAQVAGLLFKKLGLQPVGELGKNGEYSTGKNVLRKLSGAHPVVPLIIEYKKASKLLGTYINGLPENINPKTERIHTSLNQTGTETGRLSSSNPNLQNIPSPGDNTGGSLRKVFCAPDGCKIISADYSQIELRVIADLSQDENLIAAFNSGIDVHKVTASRIFGINLNDIKDDDPRRKIAKGINFGIVYGMSAKGLAESLTLSTGKLVSEDDARNYISKYFSEFSGILAFVQKCEVQLLNTGFVSTKFGRRRNIPEIYSMKKSDRNYARRAAVNTVVQGTAADIIKLSMKRVNEILTTYRTKMLLQIHDELVFESPDSEVQIVLPLIKDAMEHITELSVPLVVNINAGANWHEAH